MFGKAKNLLNLDKSSKQEQLNNSAQASYDTLQNTSITSADISVKYILSENQQDGIFVFNLIHALLKTHSFLLRKVSFVLQQNFLKHKEITPLVVMLFRRTSCLPLWTNSFQMKI